MAQIEKSIEMLETEIALTDSTIRTMIESNVIKKSTLKEMYNTHYSLNLSSIDIDVKIKDKENLINISNYNKNISIIEKHIKKDINKIQLKIKEIEQTFIKTQNDQYKLKKIEEKEVGKIKEKEVGKVKEKEVKKVEEKEVEKVEEEKKKAEENKSEEKKAEEKLKKDIEKSKLKKEKETKENNDSSTDEHEGEGCIFIFDKGQKIGTKCCRVTKYGRYCGYHKKFNTS